MGTTSKTWEYQGVFLEPFGQHARNLITQIFCNACRKGRVSSVETLIDWVADDVLRRRANLARGYGSPSDHTESTLRSLWEVMNTPEMRDFAHFILWRESLPWDEREKLKQSRGVDYATVAMAQKKPTPKQLAYLRVLGCSEIPETMADASRLIGEYKR